MSYMDLIDEYDEFINDQHNPIEINGVKHSASDILKRDMKSYLEGFAAWRENNEYDF